MDELKNNNKEEDGGKKKDSGSITVILEVNSHCNCDGCTSRVMDSIRSFEGVESVNCSDDDKNKLTVVGKVDPVKLRENAEQEIKKQVVLISPLPEKDKWDKNHKDTNDGDGVAKKNEDTTKPPMATMVLNMHLHCEGCLRNICKIVTKTKGHHQITIDRQKNLVTVKGSMEMKELAESLMKKLKKDIEIVLLENSELRISQGLVGRTIKQMVMTMVGIDGDEGTIGDTKEEAEQRRRDFSADGYEGTREDTKDKPGVGGKKYKGANSGGGKKEKDGGRRRRRYLLWNVR